MTAMVKAYNVSWTIVESGRTCWKGVVLMNIDGRLWKHKCDHEHRKPDTAWACAEAIGEKYL